MKQIRENISEAKKIIEVEDQVMRQIRESIHKGFHLELTPRQEQVVFQIGIDELSLAKIRALGGLKLFQENDEAVRIGIQKLRPKLNERNTLYWINVCFLIIS